MLSHAWKKLAKEYDLTIGNGVAYGEFRGYNATFSDGSNTKRVDFSVYVPDNTAYDRLEEELNTRDLEKEFRIEDFQLDESRIVIIFKDAPGTVKRIMNFLDWFLPKLSECGIGGAGVCAYCGRPLEKNASWKQIDGTAYRLHRSCADRISNRLEQVYEEEKAARTGSCLTGLIGALLGGLLGAVIWAFVLYSGYVAAIVGFLIGFFAELGYRLFHGRKGKRKFVILLLVSAFCVVVGTFGADVIELVVEMNAGHLPGFRVEDIVPTIIETFRQNSEYRTYVISNLVMGFIFACLGMFTILLNALRESRPTKMKDLK